MTDPAPKVTLVDGVDKITWYGGTFRIFLEPPPYVAVDTFGQLWKLGQWKRENDCWLKPGQGCYVFGPAGRWGARPIWVAWHGLGPEPIRIRDQKAMIGSLGWVHLLGGSGRPQHILRMLCAMAQIAKEY